MKRIAVACLMTAVAAFAGTTVLAGAAHAAWSDLPVVEYPKDNLFTPEKAELGKKLFFDPRVSGSNIMSCATCHNPAMGWADGLPKGKGHNMKELGRNSPTIINSAYNATQFWDGRAASLEEQAKGPIMSDAEMHEQGEEELIRELTAVPYYVREFERVFPGEGISLDTVAKAIATYERTVVSTDSPFDDFMNGDENAISDAAKRGFELFRGKARCQSCHAGPNFTDNRFHDIGVDDGDKGRIAVTGKKRDQFKFKTPTLRDVTRTAPYLHNGQEATLMEVMHFYNRGGDRKGNELKPLNLTDQEMMDVVAFMESLTGPQVLVTLPELP